MLRKGLDGLQDLSEKMPWFFEGNETGIDIGMDFFMRDGGVVQKDGGMIVKMLEDGLPERIERLMGGNADIALIYGAESDFVLGFEGEFLRIGQH